MYYDQYGTWSTHGSATGGSCTGDLLIPYYNRIFFNDAIVSQALLNIRQNSYTDSGCGISADGQLWWIAPPVTAYGSDGDTAGYCLDYTGYIGKRLNSLGAAGNPGADYLCKKNGAIQ